MHDFCGLINSVVLSRVSFMIVMLSCTIRYEGCIAKTNQQGGPLNSQCWPPGYKRMTYMLYFCMSFETPTAGTDFKKNQGKVLLGIERFGEVFLLLLRAFPEIQYFEMRRYVCHYLTFLVFCHHYDCHHYGSI